MSYVPLNLPAIRVGTGAVDNTELGYLDGATSNIQTQLDNKQPLDATLTAVAVYNNNGIFTQVAADSFTARTITAGTGINVTNGSGVSGNPTIAIDTSGYSAWDSHLSYSSGDIVIYLGNAYKVTGIATGGVNPASDLTNWTAIINSLFTRYNILSDVLYVAANGDPQIIIKPTILANTLLREGDRIKFKFMLQANNYIGSRTFKLIYEPSNIAAFFDFNVVTGVSGFANGGGFGTNNVPFTIAGECIISDSSTVAYRYNVELRASSAMIKTWNGAVFNSSFTGNIIANDSRFQLSVGSADIANNDLIVKSGYIEFIRNIN